MLGMLFGCWILDVVVVVFCWMLDVCMVEFLLDVCIVEFFLCGYLMFAVLVICRMLNMIL